MWPAFLPGKKIFSHSVPAFHKARLGIEELESRIVFAIRLDLVALHEFGHSLGLDHIPSSTPSIMNPYYNASYDLANFANDPAVAQLKTIYSSPNSGPWKDSLDGNPNGVIEISFSFMKAGNKMDQGAKSTNIPDSWKPVIIQQFQRWADAINGSGPQIISFINKGDETSNYNFNIYSSVQQNDPRFGDIRIGAHRMDGPGKVLAHAYFPPPNGYTAAGDAHFDNAEDWDTSLTSYSSSTSSSNTSTPPGSVTAFAGGKKDKDPQGDNLELAPNLDLLTLQTAAIQVFLKPSQNGHVSEATLLVLHNTQPPASAPIVVHLTGPGTSFSRQVGLPSAVEGKSNELEEMGQPSPSRPQAQIRANPVLPPTLGEGNNAVHPLISLGIPSVQENPDAFLDAFLQNRQNSLGWERAMVTEDKTPEHSESLVAGLALLLGGTWVIGAQDKRARNTRGWPEKSRIVGASS